MGKIFENSQTWERIIVKFFNMIGSSLFGKCIENYRSVNALCLFNDYVKAWTKLMIVHGGLKHV